MADRDIILAVQSLKGDLASIVTAIGGISSIRDSSGGGMLTNKNLNDLMMDNTKQLEEVSKNLGKTRESQDRNVKALEYTGAAMALLGPMLSQYAKYSIQLPMQLLSGVQGQIAQTTLGREQGLGNVVGGGIAGILGAIGFATGNPLLMAAGGVVGGLTASGGGAWMGSQLRNDVARASTRQTGIDYMASGNLDMNASYMYNYSIARGNAASRGMGAGSSGSASAISSILGRMGMGPEESAAAAQLIMSQGARGYNKFSMERAKALAENGIYGFDPIQNAIALQIGNRTGFSENELTGASRRTGFQLPQVAQVAQMVRGQTFMYGMGAGNGVFNAATNTTMSQIMGPGASAQTLMQTGQAVAGAASGNEATEMILFQQFQQANPGSSYMDFLEAKTMGSADPRWKKMMAQAAKTFSGMGQMGGLLGVGTKVFQGASAESRATSTRFLRQTAGEIGIEPLTREEEQARLDMNAQNRQERIRAEAGALPGRVAREPGLQEKMTETHIGLLKISNDNMLNLSTATVNAAKVTEEQLVPQLTILTDAINRLIAGDGSDDIRGTGP